MEADKREAWGSPSEGDGWMTGEIRRLLAAIRGEHAWKKRTTVVKLAFARAQGLPVAGVFEQEDVVSERCWYQKWKHQPAVARAFEACYERALAWRDEETAQAEAKYADERRRLIAEQSLSAVKGLALTALNVSDRADYRTEASRVLLALADEELATRLGTGGRAALAVDLGEEALFPVDKLVQAMKAAEGLADDNAGQADRGTG